MGVSKKEMERSKELARLYYLAGDTQKIAAEKAGVSKVTMSKWVNEEGWEAIRVARNITRPELISKMMQNASEKLDAKEMSFDEMSKLAAAIKEIDKSTNVVTIIEVLTMYNNWLVSRMQVDKELTTDFLKASNKYQDTFISEQVNNNKSIL